MLGSATSRSLIFAKPGCITSRVGSTGGPDLISYPIDQALGTCDIEGWNVRPITLIGSEWFRIQMGSSTRPKAEH